MTGLQVALLSFLMAGAGIGLFLLVNARQCAKKLRVWRARLEPGTLAWLRPDDPEQPEFLVKINKRPILSIVEVRFLSRVPESVWPDEIDEVPLAYLYPPD